MEINNLLLGTNGHLFGWQADTWMLLDQIGILLGLVMIALSMAGGVYAIANLDRIRRWLQRYRFPVVSAEAQGEEHWDALVFSVSHAELPAWVIETKKPKAVGLMTTADSAANAKTIVATAKRLSIDTIGLRQLSDADDPAEARDAVSCLIKKLRDQGHDRIAVDVTGGKTPMSLGAFMAAQEQGCDTVYVASDYDSKLKRPDTMTATLRCITRSQ